MSACLLAFFAFIDGVTLNRWSVATEMCVGKNRSKIMGVGTAAFWSKSQTINRLE